MTDPERFFNKVIPEPMSGCWLWLGAVGSHGYGTCWTNGGFDLAHRYSYRIHHGPIPEGLVLDHLCRVRTCVNPLHLEAVTSAVNVWRGAMTKLTVEQVRAIFVDVRPYHQIAAEYGIPPTSPGTIKRRVKWPQATADLTPHINPRGTWTLKYRQELNRRFSEGEP